MSRGELIERMAGLLSRGLIDDSEYSGVLDLVAEYENEIAELQQQLQDAIYEVESHE